MISYKEALGLMTGAATLQPDGHVDRDAALGRVCSDNVVARLDIPAFNNSEMDGFALYAMSTAGATPALPKRFKVVDCLAAGDVLASAADCNVAVEIMTGAKIPDGLDAVVQIEMVEVVRNAHGQAVEILLDAELQSGAYVRYAGDDIKAGQILAARGTRLHAGHVAAMAATGIQEVRVFDMPEVLVFTTGKEVSDVYHAPLNDGEIYDSNTPYLLAQFEDAGIPAHYAGNIGDDTQAWIDTLNADTSARIVISSGAVSMGKWDFIPDLLAKHGARVIFHRVGIKPGKPILFAILSDGRYYFGLPGNPVSTAVGLRFFVQPLIRQLMGMVPERFPYGTLNHSYKKEGGLRHFLKARLDSDDHGQMHLSILDGQESFRIAPMLDMNCWAMIDEAQHALGKDESVCIAPMALFPTAF